MKVVFLFLLVAFGIQAQSERKVFPFQRMDMEVIYTANWPKRITHNV